MRDAWDVQFDHGIWLPQLGWRLDARQGSPRSFVSHAHSDHLARHREVLCTPATARLMHERLGGRRTVTTAAWHTPQPLTLDCTVELLPAGHILGSAQFRATTAAGTLLYTGDFKLRPGLAAEPCATAQADVLIMETTFGLPRYVLPPAGEVEAAIVAFCRETLAAGATPVLYAYSLGKSQELVRLVGDAGLPVMLHPQSYHLTQVYAELGCPLPPFAPFDPLHHRGHVVITPARAELLDWINPKRTAAITGWALDAATRFRYGSDAAFALSDHADFPDLLRLVELVQPRLVYTVHGFAREFAATLRTRGVEAWALGQGNQTEFAL